MYLLFYFFVFKLKREIVAGENNCGTCCYRNITGIIPFGLQKPALISEFAANVVNLGL
jgi:hypothetical protein